MTAPSGQKPEYHYALCTWSTPKNNTLQDIEQGAAAGFEAVSIWEAKFGDASDDQIQAALDKHKVKAGIVLPHHWTIMPTPLDPQGLSIDWKTKTQGICKSIDRLAKFNPVAVMVGCGVSGDPNKRLTPVEHTVEGLKMAADTAGKHGITIGFEPLAMRRGAVVSTVAETMDVLLKVNRPNVKILWDVWHMWPEPDLLVNLRSTVDHTMGIQVNDVRNPERSWCDRLMPGDGRNVCTPIVATLIQAGWNGWYDFEVFSDDGRWGNKFPDSLWALPSEEFVNRAATSFAKVYEDAKKMAAAGNLPRQLI